MADGPQRLHSQLPDYRHRYSGGGPCGGGLGDAKRRGQLLSFIGREWRNLLVIEGVFLGFFLVWLVLVSESPAINHTGKADGLRLPQRITGQYASAAGGPLAVGTSSQLLLLRPLHDGLPQQTSGGAPQRGLQHCRIVGTGPGRRRLLGLLYNLVRLSGGTARVAAGFGLLAPLFGDPDGQPGRDPGVLAPAGVGPATASGTGLASRV